MCRTDKLTGLWVQVGLVKVGNNLLYGRHRAVPAYNQSVICHPGSPQSELDDKLASRGSEVHDSHLEVTTDKELARHFD